MKRIVALAMGLMLLTDCGAAVADEPGEDIHWVASDYYPSGANRGDAFGGYPLYVELPEDDIHVCGAPGNDRGMILIHEDRETLFSDWGYPKYDYPCIAYYDFDGDDTKEIGVITLVGSGTFISLKDLHIVTIEKTDTGDYRYIDHAFTCDDVGAFFGEGLKAKRGKKKNTVEFSFGKKTWTADLDPELPWIEADGINVKVPDSFGFVNFAFQGKGIRLRATPYVTYETQAIPGYLQGDLTADVTFDGKQFHITNIDYEPDQED